MMKESRLKELHSISVYNNSQHDKLFTSHHHVPIENKRHL